MGKKKGINAEKVMLILLALMVLVGAIVISVLFTMGREIGRALWLPIVRSF